jgi:HK97 family phage prohead protease
VSELLSVSDGVLTRSDGVLENVDFKHRIIDVIAVPWEQEARVFWRGEYWTEVFQRGAFDRVISAAGKVRVNREHRKGDTVGKVDEFNPQHEKGLLARVKVVRGTKGDELLYLAEEDMISASIGYLANKIGTDVMLDKEAKTRRVRSAFLDHLAMVEDPAYKGAEVLAVRGDGAPGKRAADEPLLATPVLDEFLRDPVISWVMERKAS